MHKTLRRKEKAQGTFLKSECKISKKWKFKCKYLAEHLKEMSIEGAEECISGSGSSRILPRKLNNWNASECALPCDRFLFSSFEGRGFSYTGAGVGL